MVAQEPVLNKNKQQNFDYIKQELELLHNCCINNGRSAFEIKRAAEPFLKRVAFEKKSRSSRRSWVVFAVIFGVIAALVCYGPTYKAAVALFRQASISMLAVWDWTDFHSAQCFLSNPLKSEEDRNFTTEDCEICANLTSVTKLNDSSMEQISEDFLKKELPVVVTAGLQAISRSGSASLEDIYQLYLEDEDMYLYSCCHFKSNIDIKKRNHRIFLKNLREGEFTQYYAHWQNCFKSAAKQFRLMYRRPEFLPTTVELADSNWLLLSSGYTNTSSLKMPVEGGVVMLVQLSGYIDVILRPRAECQSKCRTLTAQLVKGSVLIVTDLLYDIEYRPTEGKLAMTVGIGGSFDY